MGDEAACFIAVRFAGDCSVIAGGVRPASS